MGVKGLWRLLLPIGRRISIETLEGKILAIDASIWLTQFLQALKDPNTGSTLPAAHLVGFLRRLCKLRFHGIRPVLVFDGATPEIKLRELKERRQRREQFASRSGKGEDGGIVRMAKKLLTQQLQKHGRNFMKVAEEESRAKEEEGKKTSENEKGPHGTKQTSPSTSGKSTSLAPGFHDPNVEDENHHNKKEIINSAESKERADSEHAKQAQMMENDDRDILEILNDEEEAARKAREEELGEGNNDWDRAVVTQSESERERERKQNQHDEQQKKQVDTQPKWNYGRRTKKKGSASSYAAFRKQAPNGKFNVNYVASLPSHERKDWVEEAQKNRRMESRREFMKVAYDQEQFSQSQLQNFLKSSKLNQDIHKMATKAAKQESSELGVRQAGDRTKRIIFERDTESKQQAKKRSKAALLAEFSKKKLSILEDNNNKESDSYEIEWEDGDKKPAAVPTSLRTANVNGNNSDSDDDEPNRSLHTNGKYTAVPFFSSTDSNKSKRKGSTIQNSKKKPPPQTQESVARLPQKAERNDDSSNGVMMDADTKLAMQLQDQELARELAMHEHEGVIFLPAGESGPGYIVPSSDDGNDSGQGGGGFLPSTGDATNTNGGGFLTSKPAAKAATATNSDSDKNDEVDSTTAQQLADEKLARALQSTEYEGNIWGDNGPIYCNSSENDSDEGGGGFLPSGENEERVGNRGEGFLHSASSSPPKAAKAVNNDSDSDAADANAKMAQQLEDEKLAMALQNAEYEGSDHDEMGGGFLPEILVTHVKPAPAITTLEADDRKPAPKIQKEQLSMNDSGGSGGGSIPSASGVSFLKPPPNSSEATPIGPSMDNEEEDDEDGDIDWEDGGMDNDEAKQETKRMRLDEAESHPSSGAAVSRPEYKEDIPVASQEPITLRSTSKSDSCCSTSSSIEKKHKKDAMELDDFDELPTATTNDWDIGSSKSEKVSEALTHAQDTASRLTNWAGRAFRRAVAQHAEESGTQVPESSKPISLVPRPNTSEDDEEPSVVTKQYSRSPEKNNQKQANRSRKTGERRSTSSPYFDFDSDGSSSRQDNGVPKTKTTTTTTSHEQYEQDMAAFASRETNATTEMDTVTDEMKAEVMQLLHLFGVPFVEAPAEAESQCVMLETLGLVDGIVTEDSDAFVFGGKHVYKNIFDDKKYVEIYNADDAEREMNLTHDGMVGLALLLGGDYTQGVHGVGIVNGMEIIHAFGVSEDVQNLKRFRQWLDGFDFDEALAKKKQEKEEQKEKTLTKEEEFHKKHRSARNRWEAPKHFPDPRVLSAYMNPVVDKSDSPFSWGMPDLEGLVSFCTRNIGWTPAETKAIVKPVLQRMEETRNMRQTRLDTFMRYEDGIKFADVRSKRLREVLETVQGGGKDNTNEKAAEGKKQKTKNR